MKKVLVTFILICIYSLMANSVLLKDKILVLETEGTAIIGNGITIEDAKVFAINDAKRTALEMVGTYLESNTTIINHMVEKDEIKTYTGSVLKAEILKEEKCMLDNNFALVVEIKATIDTELLNKRIDETRNDNELKRMLEEQRKKVEKLTKQVAELKMKKDATKKEVKYLSNALSATDWHNKGYTSFILTNYIGAISDYTKAIELDSKFSQAYIGRGLAYDKLGDYKKTISDYTEAIELDPKYSPAYVGRGGIYFEQGNFTGAISDLTKAIELDPRYSHAYLKKGTFYMELGDFTKAILDFTKAIELDSKLLLAYVGRGGIYFEQGNFTRAISDFTKAIEFGSNNPLVYLGRGTAYYLTNRPKKSVRDFNKYLEFVGNNDGMAKDVKRMIREMGYVPKH